MSKYRGRCSRCGGEFEILDMGHLPEVEMFERHLLEYVGRAEENPYSFTEEELIAKYGYNSLTSFCKTCRAEILEHAEEEE